MVPDLDALLLSLADPSAPARRSSRKLQLHKRTTPRLARTAATGLPGAPRGRAVNEAGTLVLSARKMHSKARVRAPTQPARHVRAKATRRKPGVRAAERGPAQAAAERNDEENGVPEAADEQGLLSLSSEDGGAEEFMAAMKEMAEKRKKQQERDERKVDAFYLANMKRVQKQGEQKVFAISARASEDTRVFLADVSAQAQTLIQAARVVENEELKTATGALKTAAAVLADEMQAFDAKQRELRMVDAKDAESRRKKLTTEIAAAAKDAERATKRRNAGNKKLLDVLAMMQSL